TTKNIIKNFHANGNDTNYIVGINALSPDGKYLVCNTSIKNKYPDNYNMSDTARLMVFDLDADTIVKWIKLENKVMPRFIAYSPDGNTFVVSYEFDYTRYDVGYGRLVKYRTSDWQVDTILENYQEKYYTYLSFSSDGRYMAGTKIDTSGGSNYVWDMQADTIYKAYPFSKLGNMYFSVNFSPDSQFLLFGGTSLFNPSPLNNQIWNFSSDTAVSTCSIQGNNPIYISNGNNYLLISGKNNIHLLSINMLPSSVTEPPITSDDIRIAQENKMLIIKSKDFDLRKIEIYDIKGSFVLSETADSEEIAVSIQGMQSGIYFVKVQTARQVFVRKIMVVE
ncbi:MAG: T9SS type A sorting domain-containing protein, partial [Bacteroidota bacterium]